MYQSPRSHHSSNRFTRNRRNSQNSGRRNHLVEKIAASKFISPVVNQEPEAYTPIHTFADFAITEALQKNIQQQQYTEPTPIQDQTIPATLEGKDIIGIANTGTGKTAAFLIPVIDALAKNPKQKALIVAPTRELAVQIREEFQKLSRGLGIYSVLCIGGASSSMQKNELRRNPHVVIGTPGRLKDLIQQKGLIMQQFQTVVLDEVDRMVDIGFIKDITYLISLLPKERQSLCFSATISPQVHAIIQQFVTDPVTVSVKKQDTAANVEQDIIRVKNNDHKMETLQKLLYTTGFDKVIVFGRTKWGIQKLAKNLLEKGFKVTAIHGNKTQNQRQRALEDFKRDKVQVLLATDVASRGLDIPDVTHVINYDQPTSYEEYIHRIGRTGRANKRGTALTFVE